MGELPEIAKLIAGIKLLACVNRKNRFIVLSEVPLTKCTLRKQSSKVGKNNHYMPLSNTHRHSWLLSKFIWRQGEVARIVRMVDSDIPPILQTLSITLLHFVGS